jgi:hypothetical protein
MSNEIRQTELRDKSEQLLRGSLKHARAAALAALLVPLASVAASAQSGLTLNGSGGVMITANSSCNGYSLNVGGFGLFLPPGTAAYTIVVTNTSGQSTTLTGTISLIPTNDGSGNFSGAASGSFSPALSDGATATVTATATAGGYTSPPVTASTGQVSCALSPPSVPLPCDFVTSGGFVLTSAGKMANFGAHGGCKNDGFWGHINYVDHTNEYHLDSIQITGYLAVPSVGPNARDICGWATTNNQSDPQPVMFRARLVDNGEPGVASQFGIIVANGTVPYHVSTRLLNNGMGGGGDVQLHKDNPSTTPPSPLPTEAAMCGVLAGQAP